MTYEQFVCSAGLTDWATAFNSVERFWSTLYPRYRVDKRLERDSDGLWDGFVHLTSEDDRQRTMRLEIGPDGKIDYLSFDGADVTDRLGDRPTVDGIARAYYLYETHGTSGLNDLSAAHQPPHHSAVSTKADAWDEQDDDRTVVTLGLDTSTSTSGEKNAAIVYDKINVEPLPRPKNPAVATQPPHPPLPNSDLGDVPAHRGVFIPKTATRTKRYGQRTRQKR